MAKQFVIQEFAGRDERGQVVYREVEIPDGQWIVFASSFISEEVEYRNENPDLNSSEVRSYTIVGPAPQMRYIHDRSSNRRDYSNGFHRSRYGCSWLVGAEPFGIICDKKENGRRVGELWFSCARQVHKGELGRRPVIARPQFARPAFEFSTEKLSPVTGKPFKARDRRRGKEGWARLTDVAELAHLAPKELVRRYFDFADHGGPCLQVLFAARREEIHCQAVRHGSWQTFGLDDLPALFDRDPSTIWIRQGFALAVLYMRSFGYVPPLQNQTDD